jgi:hypothetical protein
VALVALPASLQMEILPRSVRSAMTPVSPVTTMESLMTRNSALTVTLTMAIPGESQKLNFALTTVMTHSTLQETQLVVNASLHAKTVKGQRALAPLATRTIRKNYPSCGKMSAFSNAPRATLWSRMNANPVHLPALLALRPLTNA